MRRRPRRLLVSALFSALGAGAFVAPQVGAQEVVEPPRYRSSRPYASDVEAANPKDSPFHLTGGLDLRDQYFFRGYNRASSGAVVQPYFTLLYTIYEDENIAITPHAGAWFNFTEEKGPENPQHWNQFDAIVGVGVDWNRFTFDFQWQMLKSPSEIFQRSEEIGVDIRYDDRHLWPKDSAIAAVNPSVAFFHEYYDKNDSESDAYVGVGLEPELRPFDVGRTPVTISFPLHFGGSYNGYYFDDRGGVDQAGFWSAGIKAGFDLSSSRNGPQYRLEAEVNYIRLLADSVERTNGGDGDDVMLRVGVSFEI